MQRKAQESYEKKRT